ncbi:fatty-acid amide hydrolase 2 [Caerostris darwini]|uniref:Fatty-acid amide hydrolase 2 n=1 Tax=Caerostris darwini TaxID=1538125 RepID=A0AAV4S266_9ARAC|nr:fatty-acid amide hydrolase 2 [Caerostris darwini]
MNNVIKSSDVVKSYISRIEAVQPLINAYVDERFHEAFEEAKKVDSLISSGTKTEDELERETPFLGVPFSAKEAVIFVISNLPSRYQIFYRDFHSRYQIFHGDLHPGYKSMEISIWDIEISSLIHDTKSSIEISVRFTTSLIAISIRDTTYYIAIIRDFTALIRDTKLPIAITISPTYLQSRPFAIPNLPP